MLTGFHGISTLFKSAITDSGRACKLLMRRSQAQLVVWSTLILLEFPRVIIEK